jgi:hypothetical protein|tara:strand:+ start:215 stop:451 length:237 start_codon:yes stop_codon:yes gene_type:complete
MQGVGIVKTKYVTVKVNYDTEETWDITLQEVEEIFQMMNNLKRNAVIIDIEQGANGTIDVGSLNLTAKDIGLDFNDDG